MGCRNLFSSVLLLTAFSVLCLGGTESTRLEDIIELGNDLATRVDFEEADKSALTLDNGKEEVLNTENDKKSASRRDKRQAQHINPIRLSASQECDGITLRWIKPNIPHSTTFNSSTPEFSHYNIYRETNFYSTVSGLTPIASGRDIPELQDLHREKWIDNFPPLVTGLFYAVTVVNHRGEETQNVVPKQISFFGTFDDVGRRPVRIMPGFVKGNVLHHSAAYNNFRKEYFVVFDVDLNNDDKPDAMYGWRINKRGEILTRRLVNFTINGVVTEQGHPTVAFNPNTQEYLVAWHLSASTLQGGNYIIVGQFVYGYVSLKRGNSFKLLTGRLKTGSRSIIEPKLIYNSASGGYVMTSMLIFPPKTVILSFLKPYGQVTFSRQLLEAEVLESNLFMDTKYGQVYILSQVSQRVIKVANQDTYYRHYPYILLCSKANATGSLLTASDTTRSYSGYVLGYTRERNAHVTGYFDEDNGWLTALWNNQENGKKVINSTKLVRTPGVYKRYGNVHDCSQHVNVQNAATCYLPTNNGHIIIWENGTKLSGYLVEDGAFNPVNGIQRKAMVLCHSKENRAFVMFQQTVRGSRVLFVQNIAPGAQPACSHGCKTSERCAMKNVCTPRNPVKNTHRVCSKDNGGCSHTCTSSIEKGSCSCPLSHSLSLDGMKCYFADTRANVSLLWSTKRSIWSASIYYAEQRVSFTRIPIQGQHITSSYYNEKDRFLYWADAEERKFFRAHLDGTSKQVIRRIISSNHQVVPPYGMVVDPAARQLYWTDVVSGTVFRSWLNGANRVSFITGLDKPNHLALLRKKKWLFWTSWGAVAKIERINTDGTNRVVLIRTGLQRPNSLTLDGNNLYWADAFLNKIETSDLNGNRRALVAHGGNHPDGLAVAGNRLFWTDWSGHMLSLDKRLARWSQFFGVLRMPTREPVKIASALGKPFSLQILDGPVLKARFCTDPQDPPFGRRSPPPSQVDGKYNVGNRIMLTCNPEFVHIGSKFRQCLPTGRWSGNRTQCESPPVFTRLPSNKTVKLSYGVTIECKANARATLNGKYVKKASISWYKDGKLLSRSDRYYKDDVTSYLHIPSVLVDDAGLYTCEASNAFAKKNASMYLTIRQKQIVCGKVHITAQARIFGGRRARRGFIPWQILLSNKASKTPFCGASLLSKRWGVTAAHCLVWEINGKHVLKKQLNQIVAILGEHNRGKNESSEQYMSISEAHIHPRYDEDTFDNDIALIKFTKQAAYTDYVIPVCLPVTAADVALSHARNWARVSGWGARRPNKTNSPKVLHTVNVSTVSHQTCIANHAPKYHISTNMLCAGRTDGKGDACPGDSGGPLTVRNRATGKHVLIGIVSWGEPNCGTKNKYGVYTKVQNFVRWINSYINKI